MLSYTGWKKDLQYLGFLPKSPCASPGDFPASGIHFVLAAQGACICQQTSARQALRGWLDHKVRAASPFSWKLGFVPPSTMGFRLPATWPATPALPRLPACLPQGYVKTYVLQTGQAQVSPLPLSDPGSASPCAPPHPSLSLRCFGAFASPFPNLL